MAATKTKKRKRSVDDGLAIALIKAVQELTRAVTAGTAEMRRYRRMIQNPTIALDDTPGRGIPDGALMETDRMRRALDDDDGSQ